MKRMVWNAVSTRKVEAVKDACSFASVANKLSTSVAVTFVGPKELEATADLLGLTKFFSVAPVIPGIAKFHSLEPLRNGLICCRTYSYQSTCIEMGLQFSGSENEDLDQNDSDDQDSSSLSKGSNSTSSADEGESSEEKGDFLCNASRKSHYTYNEVSSESSKEDSESHDEEGDSSEEKGLTGNKGSGKEPAMQIKVQVTRKRCQRRKISKFSRAFLTSYYHRYIQRMCFVQPSISFRLPSKCSF